MTLIVRHTAERQAYSCAKGGDAEAAQHAQQDAMLAALVAELTMRCTAMQKLLDQQRQRQLAEGVQATLAAARLAAAMTQLSSLLALQQAARA